MAKKYNHADKAGNAGDVWKHTILTMLLKNIAGKWPKKQEFHFCDTHAGAGVYELREGGAWKDGYGKLFASDEMPPHRQYHGSWFIAWKELHRELQYRITAYELDRQAWMAACDVRSHNTAVLNLDGFAHAKRANADLTFVDPPYTSVADWASANRLGISLDESFVLWNPFLLDGTHTSKLSDVYYSGDDVDTYSLRLPHDRGCAMHVCERGRMPANLLKLSKKDLKELKALAVKLGGEFVVGDPD